jgi:polyhydroxyalkanoate synthesis regulator phasin
MLEQYEALQELHNNTVEDAAIAAKDAADQIADLENQVQWSHQTWHATPKHSQMHIRIALNGPLECNGMPIVSQQELLTIWEVGLLMGTDRRADQ